MNFNLKLPELAKKIRALKKKPKLILVQAPEGIKPQVKEIAGFLEKELGTTFAEQGFEKKKLGTTIIASIEPCFGACDLAVKEAEFLNADLIVHFGHSDFGVKSKARVIYWPVEVPINEEKVAERIVEECSRRNFAKILLGTTIQHLQGVKRVEKLLREKSIQASTIQVLGCTAIKANGLDALFFIGSGNFHSLGMLYSTTSFKKVFALNPESLSVKELDSEKDAYYRRRISQISLSSQAKNFGILLSTKPGQLNIKAALLAKKLLEEKNKTAVLLSANLLKPEYLTGMLFDAFVNTACPRIAADDSMLYGKPVLSFKELEIALGKRKMEEFK